MVLVGDILLYDNIFLSRDVSDKYLMVIFMEKRKYVLLQNTVVLKFENSGKKQTSNIANLLVFFQFLYLIYNIKYETKSTFLVML